MMANARGDPQTGLQVRIGIMGSACPAEEPAVASLCRALGRPVSHRGCCLLTGACPGLLEYDVLIFTGLGPMGRELVNIRSSDIVIVVGGRYAAGYVCSCTPDSRAVS
jgi:predicted Rossmann-fold nucleotide-binding protein